MVSKNETLWRKYRKYALLAVPYRDLVITRGRGAWVYDADGNRYLDMSSGQFSAILGHADRKLSAVVKSQLSRTIHTSDHLMCDTVLEAMAEIASIAPSGMNKVLFLSTGSEANECAFRIAKSYTGRNGVVGFDRGYYGLTLATQSVTWNGRYADPCVPNSECIPVPAPMEVPEGMDLSQYEDRCLSEAKRVLRGNGRRNTAICIVEPILSAGGMLFPRRGYLDRLCALVRAEGAILAFDEAQTGVGRTGKWFAGPSRRAKADMLILSKGVGCGLPVSAVILRDEIAHNLEGRYLHFSSHQNDPVGAAAVLHVIRRIREDDLLSQVRDTGRYLLQQLKSLEKDTPWITNCRGKGLMAAFELNHEMFTEWRAYNAGFVLQDMLEDAGVLVQPIARGRIFRLLPPYTVTRGEIDFFIDRLHRCVSQLSEDNPCSKKMERRFHHSIRSGFFGMFHPESRKEPS